MPAGRLADDQTRQVGYGVIRTADGEGAMGDSANYCSAVIGRARDELPHTPCFGRKGQGQPRPRSEARCGIHAIVANEKRYSAPSRSRCPRLERTR